MTDADRARRYRATTATIYSAEAGDMIRIDLADAATWPESLFLGRNLPPTP